MVISGRIQTGSYTNRDGQKVYTTDVVAEEVEFAESKATSDALRNNSGMGGGYQPQGTVCAESLRSSRRWFYEHSGWN